MLSAAVRRRESPYLLSHIRFASSAPRYSSTSAESGVAGNPTPASPGPPPIRIAQTDSAGRGVFATRPITAGELIHSAKSIVTHPSASHLLDVCYYCLRTKKGNEGLSLGSYYFCSESCRDHSKVFHEVETRADWSLFNEHCRLHSLKYPLMVKRLACMVISGRARADCINILQPSLLHQESIQQMEEEFKLMDYTFKKAQIKDELMTFLSKEWYINVLARIRVNSFRIELVGGLYEDLLTSAVGLVGDDVSVGNAIYMVPSFYNHDCDPNAHIVWVDSADAKMKALRDIEEGEELRICYIDASLECEARQEILYKGFGFHCACPRCLLGD